MQILYTERNDQTPLLGMDWLKKFNLTIRNIRLDENNQSEKKQVIEKFPDKFKNKTTIKDTEIKIQLKLGPYLVEQNANDTIKSSRKNRTKIGKSKKTGHQEKVEHVDEDCFVSPVVIAIKNVKSIKINWILENLTTAV